jgi:cytochrome c2
MTSAGFFFLRIPGAQSEPFEISIPSETILQGKTEKGGALFNRKCASCHYSDREDAKHGPGLKNILKKEALPSSKRPATVENISLQLRKPYRVMPSFTSLSEQELADLLAYLKTL